MTLTTIPPHLRHSRTLDDTLVDYASNFPHAIAESVTMTKRRIGNFSAPLLSIYSEIDGFPIDFARVVSY